MSKVQKIYRELRKFGDPEAARKMTQIILEAYAESTARK